MSIPGVEDVGLAGRPQSVNIFHELRLVMFRSIAFLHAELGSARLQGVRDNHIVSLKLYRCPDY